MKVEEELEKEEYKRLEEFRQASFRSNYPFLDSDVKQMIWDNLIEICLKEKRSDDKINNTSAFYIEYNNRIEKYMREKILSELD
jgi:hypothetical protein